MGQVSKGKYHIYVENDANDSRIISCSNTETPDAFSSGYYLRLRMDKNEAAIVDADVILVVKDGKIIERGRHTELMNKKGYYYQLYTRQYEEMVTNMVA